jgi:hypothetical protein
MHAPLYLFTYDFPHVKSEQIVLGCVRGGATIAGILAAPRIELQKRSEWRGFSPLPILEPLGPGRLADNLGIPYFRVPHGDADEIRRIVPPGSIAIIGGARILKADVIKLFDGGIVNYHPGKIPETSGLDSFYWMLEKEVPPVVTTHFIDSRVDAGRLIGYESVQLDANDTPATVVYKLHLAELRSHASVVDCIVAGNAIDSVPISRPTSNRPMTDEQKRQAFRKFGSWLGQRMASVL